MASDNRGPCPGGGAKMVSLNCLTLICLIPGSMSLGWGQKVFIIIDFLILFHENNLGR